MKKKITHIRAIAILAIFLVIIAIPIINGNLKLVKDIASYENRKMATKPVFDIKNLDPYPSLYDKYYNDNFSLRARLIRFYNLVKLTFFDISPIPKELVIGKNGWLYMASNEVETYCGKNPLTSKELEWFRKELEYRNEYLTKQGCKFYYLIAPVKQKIYPEFMADNYYQLSDKSWGQQLIDYMEANSSFKIINVYDALKNHKDSNMVYYKLDNHWNRYGGFVAANEALKTFQQQFPEISTNNINNFTIQKTVTTKGNLVKMLSVDSYTDTTFEVVPKNGFQAINVAPAGYLVTKGFPYPKEFEKDKERKGKKLKILIVSDSFGGNFMPYLAEQFGRTVLIFDAWQYKLNEDIVKSEKPDIFLLITLESKLRNMQNYPARPKD